MRWLCLLVLVGCAGTTVRYEREHVRGAWGFVPPEPGSIEQVGRCEAKLRVRVIDAEFRAVRGARVVASSYVRVGAIEETLGAYFYRAHVVLTDEHGFARVCRPDNLPPYSIWENIGGGWIDRSRGQIDVFHDKRAATLHPPFTAQIVLPD